MSMLEQIPSEEIGERLRLAREALKITQAQAADAIKVARTTLVAIEKGERRARMSEFQHLAMLYKTTVNALLRREAVHIDLSPRFRKLISAEDTTANEAADLLANLAKAEVELENLLGIKRRRNYPPERPIMPGDVRTQAENDATELRQRLGLGSAPISDIIALLELELGVRVYVRRIDSKVSGLFAYDDSLGACMLLNAKHARERRTQSAGHEMGHLVSTRHQPEVLYSEGFGNSREERYADAFGRALLTPARAVMQKFQEIIAGAERISRRHVIILAHFFGVSREAIVRRLEELQLVKQGTWNWFQDQGRITNEHVRQVLGENSVSDAYKADADRPTTYRLNLLAAEAYRKDLLSEGQLAQLLQLDRVELREVLTNQELEGREADEATILPR